MTRRAISTTGAPAAIGPYSQGIVVDGFLFCAGQAALDPATGALVEGGIEPETERVMANLSAVLDAAGAALGRRRQDDDLPRRHGRLRDGQRRSTAGSSAIRRRPARRSASPRCPKGARVEIEVVARLG